MGNLCIIQCASNVGVRFTFTWLNTLSHSRSTCGPEARNHDPSLCGLLFPPRWRELIEFAELYFRRKRECDYLLDRSGEPLNMNDAAADLLPPVIL
jgi:hypothetical protein